MGKKVNAYRVNSLSKVKKELYVEGDIFITSRSVGVLVNNNIKTFANSPQDMSEYVKRNEVEQMIEDAMKEGD